MVLLVECKFEVWLRRECLFPITHQLKTPKRLIFLQNKANSPKSAKYDDTVFWSLKNTYEFRDLKNLEMTQK